MKRRFIGGLMAAALLAGTCSAVFQDIQSPELAQTAAVLEDLGIMEGDKTSSFAPQRQLTRAEFAKLLVSAFGITDVTAYKNFTVFPDVPNSHWAAGYINAAVKHADLKKMGIIHGYADGTFQPDKAVSYGEACTMLAGADAWLYHRGSRPHVAWGLYCPRPVRRADRRRFCYDGKQHLNPCRCRCDAA